MQVDGFTLPVWGRAMADRLKEIGLNIDFVSISGLRHEMSRKDQLQSFGPGVEILGRHCCVSVYLDPCNEVALLRDRL